MPNALIFSTNISKKYIMTIIVTPTPYTITNDITDTTDNTNITYTNPTTTNNTTDTTITNTTDTNKTPQPPPTPLSPLKPPTPLSTAVPHLDNINIINHLCTTNSTTKIVIVKNVPQPIQPSQIILPPKMKILPAKPKGGRFIRLRT